MTITLTWWVIPTAITIICLLFAVYLPTDSDGYGGDGLILLLRLIPALLISMISWIFTAILK